MRTRRLRLTCDIAQIPTDTTPPPALETRPIQAPWYRRCPVPRACQRLDALQEDTTSASTWCRAQTLHSYVDFSFPFASFPLLTRVPSSVHGRDRRRRFPRYWLGFWPWAQGEAHAEQMQRLEYGRFSFRFLEHRYFADRRRLAGVLACARMTGRRQVLEGREG